MDERLKRTGNIEIVAIKRKKETNIVYLSDGQNFICDEETSLNFRLYVHKILSPFEIKKIKLETKNYLDLKKYIKYLSKYKVSKSYFKERLKKKEGLNDEQIKKIMFELDYKRHLFDDKTLREEYLNYYLSKGYSYKQCEKKLADKFLFFNDSNFPFDEEIEKENLRKQIKTLKQKFDKYGSLAKYKIRNSLINSGFKIYLIDEEISHIKFEQEVNIDQARLDAMKLLRRAKGDKQKFYRSMRRLGYNQKVIYQLMEEYFND